MRPAHAPAPTAWMPPITMTNDRLEQLHQLAPGSRPVAQPSYLSIPWLCNPTSSLSLEPMDTLSIARVQTTVCSAILIKKYIETRLQVSQEDVFSSAFIVCNQRKPALNASFTWLRERRTGRTKRISSTRLGACRQAAERQDGRDVPNVRDFLC